MTEITDPMERTNAILEEANRRGIRTFWIGVATGFVIGLIAGASAIGLIGGLMLLDALQPGQQSVTVSAWY